jgi:hypothetical protein
VFELYFASGVVRTATNQAVSITDVVASFVNLIIIFSTVYELHPMKKSMQGIELAP